MVTWGPRHPKARLNLNGASMGVDESVAAPEKWEVDAARRTRWEHARFAAYVLGLGLLVWGVFEISAAVRAQTRVMATSRGKPAPEGD